MVNPVLARLVLKAKVSMVAITSRWVSYSAQQHCHYVNQSSIPVLLINFHLGKIWQWEERVWREAFQGWWRSIRFWPPDMSQPDHLPLVDCPWNPVLHTVRVLLHLRYLLLNKHNRQNFVPWKAFCTWGFSGRISIQETNRGFPLKCGRKCIFIIMHFPKKINLSNIVFRYWLHL